MLDSADFVSLLNSWRKADCHRFKHCSADKQTNLRDEHVHRLGHGHGCRACERELRIRGVVVPVFGRH
jgi:hypothetical protein